MGGWLSGARGERGGRWIESLLWPQVAGVRGIVWQLVSVAGSLVGFKLAAEPTPGFEERKGLF